MKVFLGDREVIFLNAPPDETENKTDMVTGFRDGPGLVSAWTDFLRYEKYRRLLVVDQAMKDPAASQAFSEFKAGFRFLKAAGGLVRNGNGDCLFIHRFGHWDLPKGKMERRDGGSSEAAALREVREETGLKHLEIIGTLPDTWHIYEAGEARVLKQTCWFSMVADDGQKLKPQASEGIFLARWISMKEIHCILPHTYASLREMLLEVLF